MTQEALPLPDDENEEAGGLDFERIVFFSDAVFAIIITLMVLDIRLPEVEFRTSEELAGAILNLWPAVLSYFISFYVVGQFWTAHHRMFHYIRSFDRALIGRNLLVLFFVAFIPVPTALLGKFGGLAPAPVFYAICLSIAGIAEVSMWSYVAGHRLLKADTPPGLVRLSHLRPLASITSFLISILIAIFIPISRCFPGAACISCDATWAGVMPISMFRREEVSLWTTRPIAKLPFWPNRSTTCANRACSTPSAPSKARWAGAYASMAGMC